MPNAYPKSQIIFFEDVVAGFDTANVVSKNTIQYSPGATNLERSALTVQRPIPMIANTTTGIDVSSNYSDSSELTVPATLADSNIHNHAVKFTANDLNDPIRKKRAIDAAKQALAAKLDTIVSDKISKRGSLVVTRTGEFTDYDDLSAGETALSEREIPGTYVKSLALNPRMANKMANNLAGRATDNARDHSAYERALLPSIGGFETLKSNVITSLAASTAASITVNGANQRKTPTIFDGTNATAADNRSMSITLASTGSLLVGDAFTIAGVNSVSMITKKDTGQLQTFRVIADEGSNVYTISPAIIPIDQSGDLFKQYGNCTTTPANGAAVTILNDAAKSPSIFWCKDAVEIIHSEIPVELFKESMNVMSAKTDSGITITMGQQSAIDDYTQKIRLDIWADANVLDPQMCGIYLPGQGADFG